MQRTLCLHISLNYLAMECFVFATSLGEQSMLCADGFPTCQSLPSLQWVWLMLWTISSLSQLDSAVQKGCVWAFPLADVVQCRKPFSKLPLLQAPSPFPLNLKFLRTQPDGSREASVYTYSGTNGLHDCVQENKTNFFFFFFSFPWGGCQVQISPVDLFSTTYFKFVPAAEAVRNTGPLAGGWRIQEGKILTQGKKKIII